MQRVGIIVDRGQGDLGRLGWPLSVEGFSLILVGFKLVESYLLRRRLVIYSSHFCNCSSVIRPLRVSGYKSSTLINAMDSVIAPINIVKID